MSVGSRNDKLKLGFLTAIGGREKGYVAGLLVTNQFGRPLEFQCTTPVKPNRTQQILYGPTLVPFIMGELIARTLVEKVGVKPELILTDRTEILDLRNHVSTPMFCIVEESETDDSVTIGQQTFRAHSSFLSDHEMIAEQIASMLSHADLAEPLERVRMALQETISLAAA